jgi:dTDP-L-rhamnose 4-epimerase
MIKGKVLITGGAGFIGSYTADELEKRGYKIRILDNLDSKTHFGKWPEWVKPSWEKVLGDVRNRKDWEKVLKGVDYVIHLAAMMDLLPNYSDFFDTNVTSTALLYELIVGEKLPIKKIVVASSQFVYGEGRARCESDGEVYSQVRTVEQMSTGQWNPVCPKCGRIVKALPLLETYQDPLNQYAISKYTQEMIALKLGRLNSIPSVAMRYSIVHGPRQSLKNPYSGALRIFTLQMLAGHRISIYEDGKQLRDYVSVYDVARANADVLENLKADYENFNVGGGRGITVLELSRMVAKEIGWTGKLEPTGEFRVGDIKDAVSDISKLKSLGWEPKVSEEETIKEYIAWVKKQKMEEDYVKRAEEELKKAGVVRKSR